MKSTTEPIRILSITFPMAPPNTKANPYCMHLFFSLYSQTIRPIQMAIDRALNKNGPYVVSDDKKEKLTPLLYVKNSSFCSYYLSFFLMGAGYFSSMSAIAAAAAKSLQSCPTL